MLNPSRRPMRLLQFTFDDLLLRLWRHLPKISPSVVDQSQNSMHYIPFLVVTDSSDACLEQLGRRVGTDCLVNDHLRDTSFDFSIFDHWSHLLQQNGH
jgi:hypothetical protein